MTEDLVTLRRITSRLTESPALVFSACLNKDGRLLMMSEPDDRTHTQIYVTSGTVVNHYRVIQRIGAGGMGEVYLAEDTILGRRVALKFLPDHLAGNPGVRARFTREAQAVAKLDHPNIVTIYEVGEFNGRPFFAMQYIEGKTLESYCHDEPFPISETIRLAAQISDALARAHAAGITHRDIKSANIVVDHELRPRILDFGLATIKGGELLTKEGSTLGTVAYMSPEQAEGRTTDHRSDLFSLGVVLYELLTGRTPFRRGSDAATLKAIVLESPEPLARYKADVTPELQRIVSKLLAKNPGERYQSAADLSADLRALIRSTDSGEHKITGRVPATRPSIAVLPFANMSPDPENEYFSDGLSEELLNVLAKNPELKVTGRTSSFAFKGTQGDLREIGQKLGVATLLEGSVRKAGNRVRVTAQLVSAADGFHLWSETYDRVLDDIFAVQDDVAKAVSKAMQITLVGVTEEKKKANPESYALVLRAHQSALQMSKAGLAAAVELYQKAIETDPDNARAWAGLSYALGTRVAYGHAEYRDECPKARQAAEKALALDDSLPEAHLAMSLVNVELELRIVEGEHEVRRARELAPNDSGIVGYLARVLAFRGDFDQAIPLAKQAVELDPLNPTAHLVRAYIFGYAKQWQESERAVSRALELSPDITNGRGHLSIVLMHLGRVWEGLELAQTEKSTGYRNWALAVIYHKLGRPADSDRAIATLIAEGDKWAMQIATSYGYRDEVDKAFEWLEKAHEIHDCGLLTAKVSSLLLHSTHTDPRWPVFLKKVGLAD